MSGYLETLPPPGGEKLIGADASHAWFSVFEPELGWLDFDPTNNQTPAERHITLAWGRDYSDITPLKDVIYGGGSHHTTRVRGGDRFTQPIKWGEAGRARVVLQPGGARNNVTALTGHIQIPV